MIAWIIGGVVALYFLDYMYVFGFPIGFLVYYVLMKTWYMKKYKQKEVESGYSDEYLGTTVGRDWEIPYEEK